MLNMNEAALDLDWELPQLQRQPPPPRSLTLVHNLGKRSSQM
jgi:hypothetical protein